MVDDLDEKSSEGFDLQRYLGVVRRRHLHFLIPFFLGWILVWGASWVLPPRYQSSTLILVEQPTMPKDYVTPNVNDDLQERMQSITQQILSRTGLLHIIDQFNLYFSPSSQRSPDQKVDRMRKDIDIELVRNGNQITAFNVSYSSRDPRVAQKVTSELTNLFINENLEVRQQQSEDTTKFLESQLEAARQTLSDQEEKVREFKGQHVGELPAQVGSNLQILAGLQSQLQNEQDALNTARQQQVYLETLVNQYRTLEGTPKAESGTTAGLPAVNEELDKLRAQLADLSSHYTDRHPDVRKVKEQIAKTEKMRDQLLAGLKAKAAEQAADPNSTTANADSPDTRDPSSPIVQVQSQLQANHVEIANRQRGVAELEAKVTDYQARLNQEPVREQQLSDLTRGYEQSKANYDDLLKKKNESSMATSMELLQQGERFRVVDAPSLPTKPEFPNRLKFWAIGVAAGLGLGVVIAGAFEMMDDRIHDEKELQKLLPVAVISEIPAITVAKEEQDERRRLWVGWATAGFVSVTILLGSAFSYLRG
ncbi:MAG: XrtA system polysaccharide chain length determinant [Candidatus Sulfotelmatobacter sp.]